MRKVNSMRFVVVCLILAMSLTACGNTRVQKDFATQEEVKTDHIQKVSLRLWGAERERELLQQLVEGFKEKYSDEASFDITIESMDEGEARDNILSDVNNAPDVFSFADDQLMELATSGVLEPIAYQEEVQEKNLEGAVEAATINEQIYAYPTTADNGYFMYYNKKYFSEEDVKTFDRMLEVAAKHNKYITMDWTSGWYNYSFFGNTGLTLGLNDDYVTNHCNWNSKDGEIKGVDVAKAMRRIATNKAFKNTDDTGFLSGVKDGSVIAGVSGTWNAVEMEEAWKENYGAVKLPTYTVGNSQVQMASYAGYKMLGVNSYSEHADWAEKLALYLSSEESQIKRFQIRGQGPANINASNSEEVNNSIAIKALIEQSEFASLQRVGVQYWDACSKFGIAMANGDLEGKSYQEFLDSTVEVITSSIVSK